MRFFGDLKISPSLTAAVESFPHAVKPKHQSICMRFSYLAKNLQMLHWVVLRLRESHFIKEDFCNVCKILKKYDQTNLSYHF